MRYLGGKAKIASKLAPVILQHTQGRPIWEPFVGGANMTKALDSRVCSDAHEPLIRMYQSVYSGWDPPETVSREQYAAARLLPDTDPLKAFCGFGCSFAARWFGGYTSTGSAVIQSGPKKGQPLTRNFARACRNSLLSLRQGSPDACFYLVDFMQVTPQPIGYAIYADPPYADSTGYSTGAFDHAGFWARCQDWARFTPVLVSEYSCPVPHRLLLEVTRNLEMSEGTRIERLFLVC